MDFSTPTFEQTRDKYLREVRNQNPDAAIGSDSDHYVRACAVAAVAEEIHAHLNWVYRQAFPDLADADNMRKAAAYRGLTPKPANASTGTIHFVGVPGTPIPIGTVVEVSNVGSYTATEAGVIPVGGTVDLQGRANVAGKAGDLPSGATATLSSSIDGVTSVAIVSMTGGADAESNDELLTRLLEYLGEVAQGGNAADYKRWAQNVPGVSRAYVFDLRRGNGTVDIVPMPAAGLPSGGLVAAVQAAIDQLKPCGFGVAGVLAQIPTGIVVNLAAQLVLKVGFTLAQVSPLATAAAARVFESIGPGDTLRLAQLTAAVIDVDGVQDVIWSAPVANVAALVDSTHLEIALIGTTTWTI